MQNKVLSFPLFSQRAISVMRSGRILGKKESPEELFERVVSTISQIETVWGISPKEIDKFSERFANLWKQRVFTLGTPTLTNAGRIDHKQSALSSCVVIPVDLNNKNSAQDTILSYYRQNMGSGFDFTPYENPIELLVWLNSLSAKATATGQYDRYIGNMGNLHVSHPKVHDFIRAKQQHRIPHFNISIDVNDEYMKSVLDETEYILQDGTSIDAKKLFWSIAECAWINGDPGIISLERMNRDNPVSDLAPYTSTPPCSEMGLSPGETCQFGYINVASIIKENGLVDWELLRHATETLTRALDNAIEVSLTKFPDSESTKLAKLKRKIGIGICGVADTLINIGIPYDSFQAHEYIKDILSFINFVSKQTSVHLAEVRGSCKAMKNSQSNKYYEHFLMQKYGSGSNSVSKKQWQKLSDEISKKGLLRNILTTALPPTGRASILLGVNSSIEPIFSASGWNEHTHKIIRQFLSKRVSNQNIDSLLQKAAAQDSFLNLGIPEEHVLKTAKEIDPKDHLAMMAVLAGNNGVCDETISKTVNLHNSATVEDVFEIFVTAYQLGLKNVSVYRDGTHLNQPQKL